MPPTCQEAHVVIKHKVDRSATEDIAARNAAGFAFEMLAELARGRTKSWEGLG
jgi:hypothetical protein